MRRVGLVVVVLVAGGRDRAAAGRAARAAWSGSGCARARLLVAALLAAAAPAGWPAGRRLPARAGASRRCSPRLPGPQPGAAPAAACRARAAGNAAGRRARTAPCRCRRRRPPAPGCRPPSGRPRRTTRGTSRRPAAPGCACSATSSRAAARCAPRWSRPGDVLVAAGLAQLVVRRPLLGARRRTPARAAGGLCNPGRDVRPRGGPHGQEGPQEARAQEEQGEPRQPPQRLSLHHLHDDEEPRPTAGAPRRPGIARAVGPGRQSRAARQAAQALVDHLAQVARRGEAQALADPVDRGDDPGRVARPPVDDLGGGVAGR